jgi:hypothetical protein
VRHCAKRSDSHPLRDAESSLGALFTKLDSLPLFSVRLLLIPHTQAGQCKGQKDAPGGP